MALSALLIGFLAGLRSFTPPAAVAWGAHLGALKVEGLLAVIGSTPAVAVLTILAVGELAADKWPRLPNRTTAPGVAARILTGSLAGGCIAAAAGGAPWLGALSGAIAGVAGAFAGFHARRILVSRLRAPDYAIALLEDIVAVGGSAWVILIV